jgi:aspartyl protease family protein
MTENGGPWARKPRAGGGSVPTSRSAEQARPKPAARVARGRPSSRWRFGGIWAGVIVLLILAYSFRFELGHLSGRLVGELLPFAAVTTEAGAIRLRAQRDGHYYIDAAVDGREIRFLVDTGASIVVLSPADAKRLGIKLTPADFSRRMRTAGGIVRGAPIVIRNLELGTIHLSNVSAVINEAAMAHSLLGVSALEKLGSYEVRDGTLTLRR